MRMSLGMMDFDRTLRRLMTRSINLGGWTSVTKPQMVTEWNEEVRDVPICFQLHNARERDELNDVRLCTTGFTGNLHSYAR